MSATNVTGRQRKDYSQTSAVVEEVVLKDLLPCIEELYILLAREIIDDNLSDILESRSCTNRQNQNS